MSKPALRAARNHDAHNITVHVKDRASAYYSGSSIRVEATMTLTLGQAKAFRDNLDVEIQAAEQRLAKKQKREENRKRWREREVAAGRMVLLSLKS